MNEGEVLLLIYVETSLRYNQKKGPQVDTCGLFHTLTCLETLWKCSFAVGTEQWERRNRSKAYGEIKLTPWFNLQHLIEVL